MNYDKVSYLFWSIIVLFLIFGVSIFSKYGRDMINDATFRMFFGWYVGLFIVNLFNILLNLIYHYCMKDLQGPRGLKGEIGERGLAGQDEKCGCKIDGVVTTHTTGSDGFDIDDADKIESKTVSVGTIEGASTDFQIPDSGTSDTRYLGYQGSMIISGEMDNTRVFTRLESIFSSVNTVVAPITIPLTNFTLDGITGTLNDYLKAVNFVINNLNQIVKTPIRNFETFIVSFPVTVNDDIFKPITGNGKMSNLKTSIEDILQTITDGTDLEIPTIEKPTNVSKTAYNEYVGIETTGLPADVGALTSGIYSTYLLDTSSTKNQNKVREGMKAIIGAEITNIVNLLTYYIQILDYINYEKILAEFDKVIDTLPDGATKTALQTEKAKLDKTQFDALSPTKETLIEARNELKKIIV